MALEDFLKDTETFLKAEGINARYEKFWEAFRGAEEEDKLAEQETGQNPGRADKNSQEYQEASAAKDLAEMYKARHVAKVKTNLAAIASNTSPEKLVRAAAYSLSHKEGDEKTRDMFRDYLLYIQFLHPRKDAEKEQLIALQENVRKNLPKIIAARIEEKTGDKEFSEKWGKYLAAANRSEKYGVETINAEKERIEKALIAKAGSGDFVNYIKDNAKEDRDYIEFSRALYAVEKAKD